MRKLTMVLLAALAVLPSAAATVEIDRTHAIRADGRVSMEIIFGSVTIRGGGGAEVRVTGSYDDRYVKLEIDASEDGVSIEVEPIRNSGRHSDATRLVLEVPRGVDLELEAISAGFDIRDVTGEIDIESVSGNVEISGSEMELSASTVSGDLHVNADRLLRGEFEAVSGNVDVRASLVAGGRYSFEAVSGNIVLRLPASASARFDVETFSGSITNELGPPAKKTSKYLPSKELRFSVGEGEARVSVESLSGTIKLLKD